MGFRVENKPCFQTNSVTLNLQRKLRWKFKQLHYLALDGAREQMQLQNPAATQHQSSKELLSRRQKLHKGDSVVRKTAVA